MYLKIEFFMKNFPKIVSLTINFEITVFDPNIHLANNLAIHV